MWQCNPPSFQLIDMNKGYPNRMSAIILIHAMMRHSIETRSDASFATGSGTRVYGKGSEGHTLQLFESRVREGSGSVLKSALVTLKHIT